MKEEKENKRRRRGGERYIVAGERRVFWKTK